MSSFLDKARQCWAAGDMAGVLHHVTRMYQELQHLRELPFFPAGVKEADRLLEAVGKNLLQETKGNSSGPESVNGDCIIASTVYTFGGHTAVIRDLVNALPEFPRTFWLTLAHPDAGQLHDGAIARTGLSDVLRTFDGGDVWACTLNMVEALKNLRPARVFLVHHPDDCVATVVAAAAVAMGSTVYFLHHSDLTPSAGLFLSGTTIIDFTPRATAFTRTMLGLQSVWLPLTCPDPGYTRQAFQSSGQLITSMSGSPHKFLAMSNPDYPQLVAAVLGSRQGRHVHIGPFDKRLWKRIKKCLRKRKLTEKQFVWIPTAPTLAEALHRNQVDLFLNTYPFGGARSAVEVMGSRLPMVWHSPSRDLDDIRAQMKYPEAEIWHSLDELCALLVRIDTSWLCKQGDAARDWYEKIHHPRHWAKAFADLDGAYQMELPPGFDATQVMRGLLENSLERREKATFEWRLRERIFLSKRRWKKILDDVNFLERGFFRRDSTD